MLHKVEQNETDLQTTNTSTKFLPLHLENKKPQDVLDDLHDICNDSEEMNSYSEEEDLDPDEYSSTLICASTNLKEEKCRPWNGNPGQPFLLAENP